MLLILIPNQCKCSRVRQGCIRLRGFSFQSSWYKGNHNSSQSSCLPTKNVTAHRRIHLQQCEIQKNNIVHQTLLGINMLMWWINKENSTDASCIDASQCYKRTTSSTTDHNKRTTSSTTVTRCIHRTTITSKHHQVPNPKTWHIQGK